MTTKPAAELTVPEFKIRYDIAGHKIDARTLGNSLIQTGIIIEEINRHLETGKRIEVKINALEKGSFLVHIELVETLLSTLEGFSTKENFFAASTIIGTLVDLLELKKFLGGSKIEDKQVDKGGKIIIKNTKGDVIVINELTLNIYEKDDLVKDAIAKNFDALNNEPNIEGFEITDLNGEILTRVDKADFDKMSILSESVSKDERIYTEAATLRIARLSFEGNLKWDVYLRGNRISVKLDDKDFYEDISKGKSFSKGDVLLVELEVKQKWDESVLTYVNHSYKILRVKKHIPRNEQGALDFQ